MPRSVATILCPTANENPLYRPWIDALRDPNRSTPSGPITDVRVVEEYDESWRPADDCGIVISHMQYDFPTATILQRLADEGQIPVLILADGILEYRNTFQNPKIASGSIFMPVVGHKLACIGASQARIVAGWDNAGKPEVVGLPRLDGVVKQAMGKQPETESSEIRVLVASARQPGFTEPQRLAVRQALSSVQSWFASHPTLNGKPLTPIWRLTGELQEALGVSQQKADVESNQIVDLLPTVQAVITTPSTLIVESWLFEKPTAILDFTNSPLFFSPAWHISAPTQVASTLESLLNPPAARMLFQRQMLEDTLQIRESATDRMLHLIQEMAKQGIESGNSPMKLTRRILNDPPSMKIETQSGEQAQGEAISLEELFPWSPGFRSKETDGLNIQLDQMQRHIQQLNEKLAGRRERLAQVKQDARMAWRHHDYTADQMRGLRTQIQRLQLGLRLTRRPTLLQRRLKVRGSIALQRWLFVVANALAVRRGQALGMSPGEFDLQNLFEWTGFPGGNKAPPSVKSRPSPNRRGQQIQIWKQKPADALLKKIKKQMKHRGIPEAHRGSKKSSPRFRLARSRWRAIMQVG